MFNPFTPQSTKMVMFFGQVLHSKVLPDIIRNDIIKTQEYNADQFMKTQIKEAHRQVYNADFMNHQELNREVFMLGESIMRGGM